MNRPRQRKILRQTIVASALLSAFAAPRAAEELPSAPESTIGVGLGLVTGDGRDKALFGQYNGWRAQGMGLLLDVDIVKRDEETGTWRILRGRNVGLENRELSAAYQVQGDWKIVADYSELVRRDPRTVNTGLQGAGTVAPVVLTLPALGAGADQEFRTKRVGMAVGGEKWLTSSLLFEASFKTEDKDGSRLFGKGIACGAFSPSNSVCGTPPAPGGLTGLSAATTGAILMLPEPVSSTTQQLEARLSYAGERWKLSGAYYGSFFRNALSALNPSVPGGLANPNGTALNPGIVVNSAGTTLRDILQQPIALPPGNQAHQVSLIGSYAFSPLTRATMKLAYTHARQDQDFTVFGPPAGFTSLGGVVDTMLAQVGFTTRPMSGLSLNTHWRYENRDDKTAYQWLNPYSLAQNSWEKLTGRVEANYRLPKNYQAIFGVDYQAVDRERPHGTLALADPGVSAARVETRELGYRAEVRRTISDTLSGNIGFGQSQRQGDAWLSLMQQGFPVVGDAAFSGQNTSFPTTKEDRRRDKFKLGADWTPIKNLSLQFLLEAGKDRYTAPSETGLRDTRVSNYGVDAVWNINDDWVATGYWNYGDQARHVNHSVGYVAELRDETTSVGIGVSGKPTGKLELGGGLNFVDDTNRYQFGMRSGAPLVGPGLPDVDYHLLRFSVFGKYAFQPRSAIRLEFVHQRAKLDEWTWADNGVPFTYSDNTTIALQQKQNVNYVGVAYIYKLK